MNKVRIATLNLHGTMVALHNTEVLNYLLIMISEDTCSSKL